MVVGRLLTRWVSPLAYRQYLVDDVPVDPETIVPVPPRSRDRTLGLDRVIRSSLEGFVEDIASEAWWGKEREAVSLFAFSHLIRRCAKGTPFFDPGQVGLEVSRSRGTDRLDGGKRG